MSPTCRPCAAAAADLQFSATPLARAEPLLAEAAREAAVRLRILRMWSFEYPPRIDRLLHEIGQPCAAAPGRTERLLAALHAQVLATTSAPQLLAITLWARKLYDCPMHSATRRARDLAGVDILRLLIKVRAAMSGLHCA